MDPRIWGPHTWFFLHTLTFSYPDNPNEEDKRKMFNFFNILGEVLPCSVCKVHYQENIQKYPINNFLNSRQDLVNWLIDIHNIVNRSLGKQTIDNHIIIEQYNDLYKKKYTCRLQDRFYNKYKSIILLVILIINVILILFLIYYRKRIFKIT